MIKIVVGERLDKQGWFFSAFLSAPGRFFFCISFFPVFSTFAVFFFLLLRSFFCLSNENLISSIFPCGLTTHKKMKETAEEKEIEGQGEREEKGEGV